MAGRVAEERTGISGILENKGTGGRGACTRIPQDASDSSTLIYWGELRGASIYAYSGKSKQELQNFQLTSSSNECKWASFYSILNVANSIIKYAPEVKRQDETYHESVMNSNMAEAYFMRAWTYFTLVRNFKEVP